MSTKRWRILLVVATAVGLAVRLAAVMGRPNLAAGGDPLYYWGIAKLLVEGKGWVDPFLYNLEHRVVAQTAKLPPLYTMTLTLPPLVGFKSFYASRIWSAIINTAAVPVGAGLGCDVAGRTVGAIAAFGMALYPNIWMPATVSMSETISPIMALLVLWGAYRMARDPSLRRAIILGVAIGFAALARDELVVFSFLILLPLCLPRRAAMAWSARFRRGWRPLLGGLLATAVVIVPWVTFNVVRFGQPMLITDRLGVTLASANCDQSWFGSLAGYWKQTCAVDDVAGVTGGESGQQGVATHDAVDYVERHLGSLPQVEFERLGRTFSFWNVDNQMRLDVFLEDRPDPWVWVGLGSYYGLVLLVPVGLRRLRKARVPLFPLVAVFADVVVVTLLTYGDTRFRATLEPALVLVGAVAVAGFLRCPIRPFEGLGGALGAGSDLGGQEPHGLQGGSVPGQLLAADPGGQGHAGAKERVPQE
jgi:hypothetical protein